MKFELNRLVRKNVLQLVPYSSKRDSLGDVYGKTNGNVSNIVLLDANENPFDNGVNRYPDPFQKDLKKAISKLKDISEDRIFVGNGSDEIIDICYRVFCEPGKDKAIGLKPSFSMYSITAAVNDVQYVEVPLREDFTIDVEILLQTAETNPEAKMMFICSPNNPTGNTFDADDIRKIASSFNGIIVLDEAYIDFASTPGFLSEIDRYPNMIILQTLSKAWGMAGLRLGMAYASKEIIDLFNIIKHPYNIGSASVREALRLLRRDVSKEVAIMKSERDRLAKQLSVLPSIVKVYQSEANFLLVKVAEPERFCSKMLQGGILVQDRSSSPSTPGCVRFSVGAKEQNDRLIALAASLDGVIQYNPLPRQGGIIRTTNETDIRVSVDLDNADVTYINTGIGFLDHMLDQISHHAGISLRIIAKGDTHVDEHHLVEDLAIALGEAIRKALGDKRGLARYGFSLPMDDCKATVLIDFGGRIDFEWNVPFTREMLGGIHTEMFRHFFKSLCESMMCNLHIEASGDNNHHLAEAVFKAFSRALKQAIRRDISDLHVPSSKGSLA